MAIKVDYRLVDESEEPLEDISVSMGVVDDEPVIILNQTGNEITLTLAMAEDMQTAIHQLLTNQTRKDGGKKG